VIYRITDGKTDTANSKPKSKILNSISFVVYFLWVIMMTEQGMKLKEELMNLPQSDRASLAEELLRSLDTELEENYEQEWLEEIRKRSEELKEGEVEPVEFEEVIQEALSVLK
jgi:hypothetical protein